MASIIKDYLKNLSIKIFKMEGILFKEEGYRFNLHDDHPDVPLSPNYVDLRHILRVRKMRLTIAGLIAPYIFDLEPDLLVDLPTSISPLVTSLSDMTGIDMITIRSEALKGKQKDHGDPKDILGKYKPGQKALIIDDVVSSFANTKFKAIPILEKVKLVVIPIIGVIIDREEGGAERLARKGFQTVKLLGLHSDITAICLQKGLASEKIRQMSIDYAEKVKEISRNTA